MPFKPGYVSHNAVSAVLRVQVFCGSSIALSQRVITPPLFSSD
jgi:hypothetical protein